MNNVLASLDRAGRVQGRQLVLDVLQAWSPSIEPGSPAELRALRLIEQWGFPTPVTQHVVRDEAGRLVGRLDLAYPDHLVGVEYAGVRWHNPRRWEEDERRAGALRALGWKLLELAKTDLLPSERAFRDGLSRALSRSLRAAPQDVRRSAQRPA